MTTLMIEAALRGFLLAVIVGAGLSLLRVKHVPARKAAWSLVLVASIAMPLLMRWPLLASLQGKLAWALPIRMTGPVAPPASAPTISVQAPAEAATQKSAPTPAEAMRTDTSAATPAETTAFPVVEPSEMANPENSAPAPARKFTWSSIEQLAMWTYLAIAGALLLRLLLGLAAALRLWGTAEPVSPLVAPDGNVRSSKGIASPVTVGSGIVLPADYAQWERSRLRMVLAHERSHVRQMDFWLQLLAGLYTAAFWFSPLGWWLRRKLAQLGEAISDRAGMEAAQSSSAYAQVVLEFAAMPRQRVPGVAMASAGNLSRRIDSLLNEHRFRSAFAEGRRRALASLLLIPAAWFVVMVLIRVPVAAAQPVPANSALQTAPAQPGPSAAPSSSGPAQAQAPPASEAPRTGQAFAGTAPNAEQVSGPPTATPPPAPAAPAAPPISGQTTVPPGAQQTPPLPPPAPGIVDGRGSGAGAGQLTLGSGTTIITTRRKGSSSRDFDYHALPDGNAWAVASGTWSDANLPAGLSASHRADIERAHRMANGPFLWFTQAGKSYIVTDSVAVGRIEGMYQAIGALGPEEQELTVEVPNLSQILAQSRKAMAKAQVEFGQQYAQSMAEYQADMKAAQAYFSPERMAELEKQVQDSMKSAQQWMSPQKQAELQAEIDQAQQGLQAAQAHWNAQSQAEMQARMAEAQRRIAEAEKRMETALGRWNAQSQARMQARMAEMEKRLAEQQRRTQERGIDPQVERIIQDSLANGTARVVQ
ncbi:MAG TPA: M56 family metallopeptidase [Acidobacteriaceae bacterium]|nr:M56 family metallopeptidase [Acidobacteriaceae bacterium]